MASERDKQELLRRLQRDLSTCRKHELDERWGATERQAAESVMSSALKREVGWSEIVPETHNPIYYLAEKCWYDEDDPRYQLWPPFHRDRVAGPIMEYILDPKPSVAGLLLLAPRDSFKSIFNHGIVPMWFLLRKKHLNNTDARIHLEHHKEPMASANLIRLKGKFLFHPWVRDTWGEACPAYGDKNFGTKTEFRLPWVSEGGSMSDPSVFASGSTASITGAHVDLRCGDDLVTEEHMTSKRIRDDAALRYEAKQFTLDTHSGREVNTGTRYHIRDLWQIMENAEIDSKPLYKVYKIKAIEDDDTLSLPNRITHEFLEARLNKIKATYGNDVMWYLQYQNDPRSSGLLLAHPSWIKMVRLVDLPGRSWRVITADGAWKGTKNAGEGDSAAIEVWSLERRGSLILRTLLDGVYSNELTALDGTKHIFRLMNKWNTIDVAPEEHGGYTFRTMLENEALTRGAFINIIELRSKQTNKQQRMSTFLKEMQAGRVFVSEECDAELKKAFRAQVLDFPQCIDDECDALDAAAYTMDEEIQESYAPNWREHGNERERSVAAAISGQRTRHCQA